MRDRTNTTRSQHDGAASPHHAYNMFTAGCLPNTAADEAFVTAVQNKPAAGCGANAYTRIDELARLLSAAAQGSCPAFGYHGMWGVFSEPPKVARPNRAQKANAQLFTYGSSKAAFLHNETCVREAGEPVRQICEVGFNAGHTSLLWLEAVPTARVTAFDMGDMAYAAKQAALLKRAYGNRFEVVWGSSLETVPAHALRLRKTCDVVFLDGGKSEELRLADLRNFQNVSTLGALLLFDEATTLACVQGYGNRVASCGSLKQTWGGTAYAYHNAARAGLIHVSSCSWPAGLEGKDGVCAARYASRQVASIHSVDRHELVTSNGGLNVFQPRWDPVEPTCPTGEHCRVIMLTSLLVAGHKNTHFDGSFNVFTTGKVGSATKLVLRFLKHMSEAMRPSQREHTLHVVTDLPGMPAKLQSRDGWATAVMEQVDSFNLPPIDSRYQLYLHLLRRLKPSPSDCIFAVDLADVQMLASPSKLCLAHPTTLMVESGTCNGKVTAVWQKRITKLTNWSASPRYQTFLDDPAAVRLSAGIHGGAWRVYKTFLLEMVARVDYHWLTIGQKYGYDGEQNSVDMMVINEIPLETQQPVLTGYPFGPLNMPLAGHACNTPCVGKRDHSDRCQKFERAWKAQLGRMLPNYYFAHKRSLVPGKMLY